MGRKFMISLVRHGETMANRQKIMQGQMNTLLSDLGLKQAQMVAGRLENEKFTHIFSSDLARAADTARAIVEANKCFSGELVLDRRLRERGFGNLEGKRFTDYRQAAEDANIPMQSFTPEGGETLEQVTERATDFFTYLCTVMAEPLMDSNSESSKKSNGTSNHGAKFEESNMWISEDKRTADSLGPLCVVIPNCNEFSERKFDPTSDRGSSCSNTDSTMSDLHISQCRQQIQSCDKSLSLASVLVVSHGLLLRELTQLILGKYEGQLLRNQVMEAGRISPNTGLSQFTMCVFINNNKVCVKCDQVNLISDISHLSSSSDDLISHAKFQGAL